jgi:DNA-binding MarR family transcriptional regulator
LTSTTNAVNTILVVCGPAAAGDRFDKDDGMAGRKKPTKPTLPLRRAAPTRRSPRPAIALDALSNHLGYFVRRFQVWVFQDFIRTLAGVDISPAQFSVLAVTDANRGLSQAELAAALGIERARLVRLLHRLERRGLVKRLPSSADGRRHALQLTAQGRTLLARAKTLAARHQKRLIERLGAERHQMMLDALRDF